MKLYNYNSFLNESRDHEIHQICEKYGIRDYTINRDGTIDVDGSVSFYNKKLYRIPLRFNHVRLNFICSYNYNLTSLEGCPKYVGGSFACTECMSLNSLVGCPEFIGGDFFCVDSGVMDFKGFPEFYEGRVYFGGNPVSQILRPIPLSKECQFIHLLNEYDVIRNGKTIIRDRLEAAYEGIGMELPDDINIYGYEII